MCRVQGPRARTVRFNPLYQLSAQLGTTVQTQRHKLHVWLVSFAHRAPIRRKSARLGHSVAQVSSKRRAAWVTTALRTRPLRLIVHLGIFAQRLQSQQPVHCQRTAHRGPARTRRARLVHFARRHTIK